MYMYVCIYGYQTGNPAICRKKAFTYLYIVLISRRLTQIIISPSGAFEDELSCIFLSVYIVCFEKFFNKHVLPEEKNSFVAVTFKGMKILMSPMLLIRVNMVLL